MKIKIVSRISELPMMGLSYDGYMYSYPDSFIKKKSAYIALCDSLRQCEEFIDDIKLLL